MVDKMMKDFEDILYYTFHLNYDEQSALKVLNFLTNNELYYLASLMGEYFTLIFVNSFYILEQCLTINLKINYDIEASKNIQSILKLKTLSNEERNKIWKRYPDSLKDRYSFYNSSKVNEILTIKNSNSISLTITTCKRLNLFIKTINSFLNCCSDLHLIQSWYCIDDNSSDHDREKMRILYPFFNFYNKNLTEKGHAKSMNIIKNLVSTPYILHLEDDWEFFIKYSLITDLLEILNHTKRDQIVMQCLINKNYGETIEDIDIQGGLRQETFSGLEYYIHQWAWNDDLILKC